MKKIAIALVAALLGIALALAASSGMPRWAGLPVVVWQVLGAFAVQWLMYLHSLARRTERFFDLTGSLTYVALAAAGLATGGHRSPVGWMLAGLVIVWAARLGSFLFARISRAGRDDRFDAILTDPARLFLTWSLQGLWVSLTALAAWVGMQSARGPIDWLTWLGALVWLVGFILEVVADRQKSAFRASPQHRDEFIRTGLWAWSRHPNYFGEILLWVGVLVAASPHLHGWQWLAVVSPLFVTLLLTRVSGIPLLEEKADQRWGSRPGYQQYKASTPVLLPRPPRS